ncbi:hypothetical protein DFH11DRAFT_1575583 [Phellopilus nigrolimitatus]|nr:hypothetical protein DFH11DRAFT_1575583 [Phellopilus nigrolimitatus]
MKISMTNDAYNPTPSDVTALHLPIASPSRLALSGASHRVCTPGQWAEAEGVASEEWCDDAGQRNASVQHPFAGLRGPSRLRALPAVVLRQRSRSRRARVRVYTGAARRRGRGRARGARGQRARGGDGHAGRRGRARTRRQACCKPRRPRVAREGHGRGRGARAVHGHGVAQPALLLLAGRRAGGRVRRVRERRRHGDVQRRGAVQVRARALQPRAPAGGRLARGSRGVLVGGRGRGLAATGDARARRRHGQGHRGERADGAGRGLVVAAAGGRARPGICRVPARAGRCERRRHGLGERGGRGSAQQHAGVVHGDGGQRDETRRDEAGRNEKRRRTATTKRQRRREKAEAKAEGRERREWGI